MLIAYFAVVVGAAHLFSRRIEGLKDYFLAGRTLSAWPVAFTFAASWFGAASTMGSINAFHDRGLSGLWDIVIPSLLSFIVITTWMARAVARQSAMSMPEAVAVHYGRAGQLLLSVILLASVTTLLGSQMVAAGKVFQGVFGLDLVMATVACTTIVVGYTMVGGYFAVVVTDFLQMLFVGVGFLILLAFTALWAVPDAAHLQTFLHSQPASFWDWRGNLPHHLSLAFTFVLAWCIAPEMWQRMASARSPEKARQAGVRATGIMVFLFAVVTAIGLMSTQIVGQSDAVLVDLALKIPNPVLGSLVLLGFVAAVTSTMDSGISVGSLTLGRDLYQGFLRPQASTTEVLWASRLSAIAIVIPAMVIALAYKDIIRILWVSADIYASTMFFPIMAILHMKHPGRRSGVWAMASGGVGVLISMAVQNQFLAIPWPDWPYSTLLSVGMSGLGFALGYALDTRERQQSEAMVSAWTARAVAQSPALNPFKQAFQAEKARDAAQAEDAEPALLS